MDCCSKRAFIGFNVVDEDQIQSIDTNIIAVKFNDIAEKQKDIFIGDPQFCTECKSVLSAISNVYETDEYLSMMASKGFHKQEESKSEYVKKITPIIDQKKFLNVMSLDKGDRIWICEFCSTHNKLKIEIEELPKTSDVFYMLKSSNQKKEITEDKEITTPDTTNQQSIIFCLDTSFSMTSKTGKSRKSKLKCLIDAVKSQINQMHIQYPNRKVGLINFDDDVYILGDGHGNSNVIKLSGNDLQDFEICLSRGAQSAEMKMTTNLSSSKEKLESMLDKLKTNGSTALGPGLLASVGLALKGKPGSSVIICTDGEANIGLGDLNNTTGDNFYERVGLLAKEKGIIINVITIKGAGCKVDQLSKSAELTGGEIKRIVPEKLEGDFAKVLEEELIATDVEIKIKLHKSLKFRNAEKEFLSEDGSMLQVKLGNVTISTEYTFEYELKSADELKNFSLSPLELKELPFQAQIIYTSLDGVQIIRVATINLETIDDISVSGKEANIKLLAARAAHIVSNEAAQGQVIKAKKINKTWEKFITKIAQEYNQGNEGVDRYFKHYKVQNTKLTKALDKNVKRGIKRNSITMQNDIQNLSDSDRNDLNKSLDCLSNSGSDDEGFVDFYRFKKIRQRSFSRSPPKSVERVKSRSNSKRSGSNHSGKRIKLKKRINSGLNSPDYSDQSNSDSASPPRLNIQPSPRQNLKASPRLNRRLSPIPDKLRKRSLSRDRSSSPPLNKNNGMNKGVKISSILPRKRSESVDSMDSN